jgi:serine/threonine-protein kinase RsbW
VNPPPDSHHNTEKWHRTFPGEKEQVREARHFVKTHLPDHPEAELITSELATNAIEHTRTGTPGGAFTVTVEHHPDGIAYIEIEDQGGPAVFGLPTPNREGGEGFTS